MVTKKDDTSEFEPIVANTKKKRRPVETSVTTFADIPGEEVRGDTKLSDMGELEVRKYLMEGKRVGVSYVIPPKLKEAFAQAVLLEGLPSANGAVCGYMMDLAIKHKDEIDL